MTKGKVIRDNLHRVVRVDKYLTGDKNYPLILINVEYIGNTGTASRIELSYATLTRNADGTYTYLLNREEQEPRIVTDVNISHLRGAVSWTDPYMTRLGRDVFQEVDLNDKPSMNDQGYQAFLVIAFLLFGGPVGWLLAMAWMIGWALDQRITKIRRKRQRLMDRAYSALFGIRS